MLSLCPRPRCALVLWIQPCTCPSQQGAGHCPRSDLMGQRQLDLLVLCRRLTIGADGAHPLSNPAPALAPPPPPSPPRLPDLNAYPNPSPNPNQARAVPPSACRRTRWRRRLRSSSGARPWWPRRGGARRCAAWPYPYPYPHLYPYTPTPLPLALPLVLPLALALAL